MIGPILMKYEIVTNLRNELDTIRKECYLSPRPLFIIS